MRKSALYLGTSFSFLVAGVAAIAATTMPIGGFSSNGATGNNNTQFVIAPFTAGSQELFTASIINVNPAALNSLAALSGNNAGPAPQGGLNIRQGGLGFAGLAFGSSGTSANNGSNSNVGNSTSSQGFSSANNNAPTGLSSSGFSSENTNGASGLSSSGFSSANNSTSTTVGLGNFGSQGFSSINGNAPFGLSSAGFSSANNNAPSGLSSAGFSSVNNNASSGLSSAGQNSQNNTSSTAVSNTAATASALNSLNANASNSSAGAHPVLVLSSLIDSTNATTGSTGAVFQGIANTQISRVSFQYGTLAAASGQASAQGTVTPLLVIDDQGSGNVINRRFLPVSTGSISNSRGGGLTTVSFNANQLRINGQVQRIGVLLSQRGTVVIDNVSINGVAPSGILAQAQQSFPL